MKNLEIRIATWYDKLYGNYYFASQVFIDGERVLSLPFQYGNSEFGIAETFETLVNTEIVKTEHKWLHLYARDTPEVNISTTCIPMLKRQVKEFGLN